MAKKIKQKAKTKPEPIRKNRYSFEISERAWQLLNYLSIPLVSAIVFGFSAYCEYLLYRFLWHLLAEDIKQSQLIASLAYWTQVAIFMMSVAGFLIHSIYSLYGQFKVERQLALEKSIESENHE